jgi:hypothetical protein
MMPKERIPKLIMEWIPEKRRKRGRPRKTWMEGVQAVMIARNLERSMEKQGGMVFGFRKTATAVIKPDRQIDFRVKVQAQSSMQKYSETV